MTNIHNYADFTWKVSKILKGSGLAPKNGIWLTIKVKNLGSLSKLVPVNLTIDQYEYYAKLLRVQLHNDSGLPISKAPKFIRDAVESENKKISFWAKITNFIKNLFK
jgi:hypothetical protein